MSDYNIHDSATIYCKKKKIAHSNGAVQCIVIPEAHRFLNVGAFIWAFNWNMIPFRATSCSFLSHFELLFCSHKLD